MLRKKRVTITEQAQAAIAAGMPVDQALAEHGVADPVDEANQDTSTEEETTTTAEGEEVTDASEEEESPEGTEETTAEGGEEENSDTPAAAETDEAAFGSLLDRLQAAQMTIATQASKISALEADVQSATATQEGLMEVATHAVHRMQVGLGGAAADLSHLSADNLLATYRSTLTMFEKRLPVGGKAEVLVDDGSHDGKVVPLASPAAARATQIRK